MRIPAMVRIFLLLLAVASPALLRAQFQQPTGEELAMTADPKAPGAAAAYLNIEEITNDQQHIHSYYARIKVLTEKGKELATVELPYIQGKTMITDIKARTIHSDGTVIPLSGKPEDLLIVKTLSKDGDPLQVSQKVFTLPSVEVGSILEYRFDIRYDENLYSSPFWEIQRSYFIHQAHYAFTPFKAFMNGSHNATSSYLLDKHMNAVSTLIWRTILPAGLAVKVDFIGRYSLDLTDIPPKPEEEWMPPVESRSEEHTS